MLALVLMVFIQACGPTLPSSTPNENLRTPMNEIIPSKAQLDPPTENRNSVSFTLPQLDLGHAPTLHLRNIHVVVVPNNLSMKSEGEGILFNSTDNTIQITIDSIWIDEVIQKDFNGVLVSLVAQAQCRLVAAHIHDSNSVLSGLLFKVSKVSNVSEEWKIKNPVVQVSAPEFQMTRDECTGAQGFDQLIESTIRKDLQDHQMMSQLISEYLIPLMTKWGNP